MKPDLADSVVVPESRVAANRAGSIGIMAMLGAVSAVSYLERVCISIVSPLMMHDLSLDQPRMGQVFSAFLLGYALFQYPAGALADRLGSKRVLAWAMFSWGVMTIATAGVQLPFITASIGSLVALLVVRFLLGVAEAPTYPASARVVSTWFGRTEQGRATSVFSVGMALGSALAPPLVARLMLAWGWEKALVIISLPAFVMGWLWRVKGGDGPRTATGVATATKPAATVFRDRSAWLLALSYFLNNYAFYVFVFWFFPYLVEVRHFDIVKSSWIATAPWILTMIATPVGGTLLDLMVRRFGEPWGRRAVPMVSMTLAALLLYVGAKEQDPYLAVAELTLCEGLVMLADPIYWSSAIRLAPDSAGGSGGFMNMGGNLGGFVSASLTPLVAAKLGWVQSLNFTAALMVAGALLWFWIARPRTVA
jgi:ACS family glucarate transporter-like MFS transporter